MKILFACDMHGANLVFDKFLAEGIAQKADLLILGGDLAGKDLIPIVPEGGRWRAYENTTGALLEDEDAVAVYEARQADFGRYTARLARDEYARLRDDRKGIDELFKERLTARLDKWLDRIRDCMGNSMCLVLSPGNDDPYYIDEFISGQLSPGIMYGNNNVITIGPVTVVSVGEVTTTPWNTWREEREEDLESRIASLVKEAGETEAAIFNFHCPPASTPLDLAPVLDEQCRMVRSGGEVERKHIGSRAVREAIRVYGPLVSLHGHVHESPGMMKIGKSVAVNPGSRYDEGILCAVLFDIRDSRVCDCKIIEKA